MESISRDRVIDLMDNSNEHMSITASKKRKLCCRWYERKSVKYLNKLQHSEKIREIEIIHKGEE